MKKQNSSPHKPRENKGSKASVKRAVQGTNDPQAADAVTQQTTASAKSKTDWTWSLEESEDAMRPGLESFIRTMAAGPLGSTGEPTDRTRSSSSVDDGALPATATSSRTLREIDCQIKWLSQVNSRVVDVDTRCGEVMPPKYIEELENVIRASRRLREKLEEWGPYHPASSKLELALFGEIPPRSSKH